MNKRNAASGSPAPVPYRQMMRNRSHIVNPPDCGLSIV